MVLTLGSGQNPFDVTMPSGKMKIEKEPGGPENIVTLLKSLQSRLWEAANILRGSAVDRTDWKVCSAKTRSGR